MITWKAEFREEYENTAYLGKFIVALVVHRQAEEGDHMAWYYSLSQCDPTHRRGHGECQTHSEAKAAVERLVAEWIELAGLILKVAA